MGSLYHAVSNMKKYTFVMLSMVVSLIVVIYILAWLDDLETKRNRMLVHELVDVGDDLREAEQKIKASGFKLLYEAPIDSTINREYVQKIVVVGKTNPNLFESFAYAAQLQWMPFIHSESPYVIINATLEGKVSKIE